MNNEMQKVWEALREVYGVDLTAATLVVLVKDGDTAVRFITSYFPQETDVKGYTRKLMDQIQDKLKEKNS